MSDETLIRRAIVFLPSAEDREEANCALSRILAEKEKAEKERGEEREAFMKICEEFRIPVTAGAYLEARRITALIETLHAALEPFAKIASREDVPTLSAAEQWFLFGEKEVTFGDLRRARAAVESADKELGNSPTSASE